MKKELTSEEFNNFTRCLMNLKETCNDVDIKKGIIRQRCNDRTSVFEIDLTSIIGDMTLPLTVLKNKLDLFRLYFGQTVSIEVIEGENESDSYYVISNGISRIINKFPKLQLMDNKYMEEEELSNIFSLDDDDLILDDKLNNPITEKIKYVTLIFNTPAIQLKFNNDKASITASTQSKEQDAVFKEDIVCNINFDGNFFSNLSTIPFSIDHDDEMTFKMFKDPEQNVSLNKISTNLEGIPINIYSRSSILPEENE